MSNCNPSGADDRQLVSAAGSGESGETVEPPTGAAAPAPAVQVLTWDEGLTAADEADIRAAAAQWFGGLGRFIGRALPAWLQHTREDGDRAFTRALMVWLVGQGIWRRDELLLLEPPSDRPLGLATLHALHQISGRYPLSAVRWVSVRGSNARKRVAPILRNLALPGASGLTGLADPGTQGLVSLLLQRAVEADVPDFTVAKHESTLRAIVPAVRALRGRCLLVDLIDTIDPADGVLDLEQALPIEHVERRALSAWLHPFARGGKGDPRLRRHLEADLDDLANLLRSADLL